MSFDGSTLATAELKTFTGGVINETFLIGFADVDMMAVDLVGGRTYEFDVDGGNDAYLRIFDAFGNEVKANDDGFDSGELFTTQPYTQFVAGHSGRFYVAMSPLYLRDYDPTTTAGRVSPENPLAFPIGGASLVVTDLGSTFFPSSNSINSIVFKGLGDLTDRLQDADRQLRVEIAGAGLVSASDVELARIDLQKGDLLVIDVNGQLPGLDVLNSALRVFNGSGTQLGFDQGSGNGGDSELVFSAGATDDFYVGISGAGNILYNALDGTGVVAGDTGSFSVVFHRNPTQIGSSLANTFSTGNDNDHVVTLAGNDSVSANDGWDTVSGGDDNDTLLGGRGEDALYGDTGDDVLDGGLDSDVLVGGDGNDSIIGGNSTSADLIEGGTGNDTVLAGAGLDTVNGGADNDSLRGGSEDDVVDGGTGDDTIAGDTGNDVLAGGLGADSISGNDGLDTIDGGIGNDTITGSAGDDVIDGGLNDDDVNGGADDDALDGNLGDDTLVGAAGQDTLDGGLGIDLLTGGADADVFMFGNIASADTLTDFTLGSDRIDLTAVFGAGVVNAGNLAQFVQVTPAGAGGDSFLGVDANGAAGGFTFTAIALVENVTTVQLFDVNNFIL